MDKPLTAAREKSMRRLQMRYELSAPMRYLLSAHDYWKDRAAAEKQRADGLAASLKRIVNMGTPANTPEYILHRVKETARKALAQESAGKATCGRPTLGSMFPQVKRAIEQSRRDQEETMRRLELDNTRYKNDGTGKGANTPEEGK